VTTPSSGSQHGSVTELDRVTIRFAGDSGDGMQLTGSQFTATTALFGNDVSTLPDYPAEVSQDSRSASRAATFTRQAIALTCSSP
jgi:2-oxoglutarate ferredoxin oxidoreductase subunit alpha